ncbi:hypothetical protein [Catenulispora rubra]|uniref:hypothetical protein n=1 Tax=Catenulispora rubra TaxID=280293 RepID=UPI001891FE40|nr:hypothetical protein [Catenulispora rubra]
MSEQTQGREQDHEAVRSMSRDEYLDFLVEQAPEITEEQWQDTITILALYRGRRRTGARGGSPLDGEDGGAGA